MKTKNLYWLLIAWLLNGCAVSAYQMQKVGNESLLKPEQGLVLTRIQTWVIDSGGDKQRREFRLTTNKLDRPLETHIDETASWIKTALDDYHLLSTAAGYYSIGGLEYEGARGGLGCYQYEGTNIGHCPTNNDFHITGNRITYIGDIEIVIEQSPANNKYYIKGMTASFDPDAAQSFLQASYPQLLAKYPFEFKPMRIGKKATLNNDIHIERMKKLGII